ncbi:MAG: hypothetical protein K8R08_09590 [Methanosarcinales archaeon]|nr:hypothetical protein [Methanosarcinales archaeon]
MTGKTICHFEMIITKSYAASPRTTRAGGADLRTPGQSGTIWGGRRAYELRWESAYQ